VTKARELLVAGLVLVSAAGCGSSTSAAGNTGPGDRAANAPSIGGTPVAQTGFKAPRRLATLCGSTPCDDFATPSGNIKCFAAPSRGGFVECTVMSGLVPHPTRPACDLDRPGLEVSARGATAEPMCSGGADPAVLDARIPTLGYGSVWHRFGAFCISQKSGITCINRDGHGFFLARERWETF
jgi:hypothetical protein